MVHVSANYHVGESNPSSSALASARAALLAFVLNVTLTGDQPRPIAIRENCFQDFEFLTPRL